MGRRGKAIRIERENGRGLKEEGKGGTRLQGGGVQEGWVRRQEGGARDPRGEEDGGERVQGVEAWGFGAGVLLHEGRAPPLTDTFLTFQTQQACKRETSRKSYILRRALEII